MRTALTLTSVLLAGCLASLAPAATLLIDFSDNVGVYTGTASPAHAAGDATGANWNLAVGDVGSGLVWDDGTPATGVQVDVGRGAPAINWGIGLPEATSSAVGVPIYDTNLMRDWHYTTNNDNLGARVSGLAPGNYRVYALVREPNQLGRTYNAAIGVNMDGTTDPTVFETTPITNAAGITDWTDGKNYAATNVTVTSPTDWITVLVDPTNAGYGTLQGIQIVGAPSLPADLIVNLDLGTGAGAFSGQGVLSDPGNDYWNATNSTNSLLGPLVASDGSTQTSITFSTSGVSGSGTTANLPDNDLIQDYFYTNNTTAGFTLSGLDPAALYDLVLYGTGDVPGQGSVFQITDATGTQQVSTLGRPLADAYEEGNSYLILSGLVPDALNQITGTWTTSGPQYGGLNGLQLVQTAIPEPSSLLLLLLAVVGLGLSRGNRRRG